MKWQPGGPKTKIYHFDPVEHNNDDMFYKAVIDGKTRYIKKDECRM